MRLWRFYNYGKELYQYASDIFMNICYSISVSEPVIFAFLLYQCYNSKYISL